jgi:hypothetical protein
MGMSSKKSTTSQQSTGTSTTTPNVPQWGVDSLHDLNTSINNIAGTPAGNFVAPQNALQTQAGAGAASLDGGAPQLGQATDLANTTAGTAAPRTSAAGIFDNGISQYLNPELDNVVKTSLADFDQGAGQTRARQEAAGAGANAFGGSRFGIQEGETEGQLGRARGALDSSLRSAAYDHATGLANEDAGRRQTANDTNASLANEGLNRNTTISQLLASFGNSENANKIADVGAQQGTGDSERAITQATATAPISLAQTVAQLLGSNQLDLLTGKTTNSSGTSTGTTTSTPSTFDQIGQGIQTAAKLAALFG